MFAFGSTIDSTKRNVSRNYCERLRCKEISRPIRRILKSELMSVTVSKSLIEPPSDEAGAAERKIASASHDGGDRGRDNKPPRPNQQPGRGKRDLHGWVVLDKPVGLSATPAVAVVERLVRA